ncbi:MAG TPA: hypothetical protein VMB50_10755 [Myxococcales bacterium]|nr:hypothetical protein [Myxococcales bacterium]
MPSAALLLVALAAEPNPAALRGELRLTLSQDENVGVPPPPVVEAPDVPPAAAPPPAPTWPYPPPPPGPPPLAAVPPATPGDAGRRILFGVGLHTGGASDQFTNSTSGSEGTLGVGIYLRLGAQLDDLYGLEAEISGATLLVLDNVRGALTFDLTPLDWFSFAVGPFARDDVVVSICGFGSTTIQSVGATLRADFHLGTSRTSTGRSALTIGLVTDLGATVGSDDGSGNSLGAPGLSSAFYLTLGWARF